MRKTIVKLKDTVTAQALAHNIDYWEGVQMCSVVNEVLTIATTESFALDAELEAKVKEFDGNIV